MSEPLTVTYAEWLADLQAAADERGWDVAGAWDEETKTVVAAQPLTLYDRTNRAIAVTIKSVFLNGDLLREILAVPRA